MSTNSVFDWSDVAGSNTDVAGNGISGSSNISLGNDVFQNIMAQIAAGLIERGSDIATASTISFTGATTRALTHDLTGTTTVTAVTLTAGHWRICRAQGAFQLTASSTLIVNGSTSTNYTTTAGDLLVFFGYGSSTVRVWAISGGGVNQGTIILKQSANPTPTAEGDIQWDTDDNIIAVGDGAATQLFIPIPASTAAGDLLYLSGAKAAARLAKGTAAQMLEMNAGATAPQWGAAAGLKLLTSGTVSSAATLDIVLSSYTAYRGLMFVLENFIPATNGVSLAMRVSSNAGSSYDAGAGNYIYSSIALNSGSSTAQLGSSTGDTLLNLNPLGSTGNGSAQGVACVVEMFDQNNAALDPKVLFRTMPVTSASSTQGSFGGGFRAAAQVTTAVRFLFSSGNIASGTYAVYGYV